MPLEDDKVIELVKQTASIAKNNDSERIKALEVELQHNHTDIEMLKQQKKESAKEIEDRKDKKFSRAFVIIGGGCGIISIVIKIFETIINFLKKP